MDDELKQIQFLARALKAPRIQDAVDHLAAQARDAGWSHEHYLAAVLDRGSPLAPRLGRTCASEPPNFSRGSSYRLKNNPDRDTAFSAG